jgi:hypothetical protein
MEITLMDEKGPHCSLTQVMLERYLPDAVKAYENSTDAHMYLNHWKLTDDYWKNVKGDRDMVHFFEWEIDKKTVDKIFTDSIHKENK